MTTATAHTRDHDHDHDEERRRELAAFLRSRRERLNPAAVGLPAIGRRRTPGLRREEVAQLAGTGVTWYTWLEQGRPISVSTQVLDAVARALRLDADEHAHLFTLAGAPPPDREPEPEAVAAPLTTMLDALDPYPALVIGPRWDILGWNRAEIALVGDLDALPAARRNLLWLLFLEPTWPTLLVDWEQTAARLIAQYRAAMASHVGEPAWVGPVEELRAVSPRFREFWDRHEVTTRSPRVKRYLHPTAGLVTLEVTRLWLSERPGARLHFYTPLGDTTLDDLRALTDLPPRPFGSAVTAR
jgi:transcriptional regulator with XRE-family HTH domain